MTGPLQGRGGVMAGARGPERGVGGGRTLEERLAVFVGGGIGVGMVNRCVAGGGREVVGGGRW